MNDYFNHVGFTEFFYVSVNSKWFKIISFNKQNHFHLTHAFKRKYLPDKIWQSNVDKLLYWELTHLKLIL